MFYCYEYASILFKQTGEVVDVDSYYGDPCCAAISPDESWVLIGKDHLTLWHNGEATILDYISWVRDVRAVDRTTAEALTDPWQPDSAVWKIDIPSGRVEKMREFTRYRDQPWVEHVEW